MIDVRRCKGCRRYAILVSCPCCIISPWQRWLGPVGIDARNGENRGRVRACLSVLRLLATLRCNAVIASPEARRKLLILQPHTVLHGEP